MKSNERSQGWEEIASTFNVIAARHLAAMHCMERHQDIRADIRWLTADQQPLALIFFSHRWRTLQHPDPESSDLHGIQRFLGRVTAAVEALLVDRKERLEIIGSLLVEGDLQAEEIARRIVGFGPFADRTVAMPSRDAKDVVREAFRTHRGDSAAFRDWLLDRIGVWLDYVCMPQKPLEPGDEAEFRRSLQTLDSLVTSSTVVALRQPSDDYATRGWCASEFFLASARSFSRGLFIDLARMNQGDNVALQPGPATKGTPSTSVAGVMAESYAQDAAAFREACDEWSTFEAAFIDSVPPAAWPEYRSLQGSTFYPATADPNPFRRVLEAIRNIEQVLIAHWLMADSDYEVDLTAEVARLLEHQGIFCTETADLVYLGLLISQHGWIEALRPLFEQGLRRYVASVPTVREAVGFPSLQVVLAPPPVQLRSLFTQVQPATAASWHSRLSTSGDHDPRERAAIDALRSGLEADPLEFRFIGATD